MVPTVFCSQVEMQAFIEQNAVLCFLLVFIVKVVGSYGIGHTSFLVTQLAQFDVLLNGLAKNTMHCHQCWYH